MKRKYIIPGAIIIGAILFPSWISHDKEKLSVPQKEKTVLVLSQDDALSKLLESKNEKEKTYDYINSKPYTDKWNLNLIEKLNPSLCIQIEKNNIPGEENSFTMYYASTNKYEQQSFRLACNIAQELHKRDFSPYMNSEYMQNTCPTGEVVSDYFNHPVLQNALTPTIILEYDAMSGLKQREIKDAIDEAVKKYFENNLPQGYPIDNLLIW